MGPNMLSVEGGHWVVGAVPLDTNAAAVTGDYVKMAHYAKLAIVIMQGAWAGGTPAVTVKQATSAAAAGEKALSFDRYWQGTALTVDTLTKTAVVSDTFNLPATANTYTIIEIDSQDLDIANSFTYVRVGIASPGSNADLIAVMYFLYQGTYAAKPETQPTVIT